VHRSAGVPAPLGAFALSASLSVTWTLPTPSPVDQHPQKTTVVCSTPPFAGTAHTTDRLTHETLIVHAPLVTLL